MKREKILSTAITLMGLISTIAFALEPGFEYKSPKIGNLPTIDGVLNDSIWSKVSSVKINHLNDATGTLVEAARVSTAMAAYDDKYLYIAIDNGEPNPGQIT
ncbi:hypothetical protein HYR99_20870, partial [Candidatus Poribacteria bacterium]|nr:hypothetical protein [Candidatus Poribacteria bacterium]